jgi:hypothetical protein
MDASLACFADRPLLGAGPFTRRFRAAGVSDFVGASKLIWRLPYGRIADRNQFWLVLEEGRGTCTTKHALLSELAREQGIDGQLTLAIYEMSERNTPGVGSVLGKYGLACIPEGHCFLRYQGARIDVTGVAAGAEPIEEFLHEEPITIEQIGAYKIDRHRRFLAEWLAERDATPALSLDEAWRIREECIAALSAATG